MELGVQPVQSGANVVHFTEAVIVCTLAHSHASKIETQHRKAEAVDSFHGVKDDLIVKRSTVQRMGMTDQRGVRRALNALIEQGFETACGAVDKEGTDCGIGR